MNTFLTLRSLPLLVVGLMFLAARAGGTITLSVVAVSVTSDALTLNVSDNMTSVDVVCVDAAGTPCSTTEDLISLPNTISATGLDTCTNYTFTLYSVELDSNSSLNNDNDSYTFSTAPLPVENLAVFISTPSMITVTWTEPSDTPEQYLLLINDTEIDSVSAGVTSFVYNSTDGAASALVADAMYMCRVVSVDNSCAGVMADVEIPCPAIHYTSGQKVAALNVLLMMLCLLSATIASF